MNLSNDVHYSGVSTQREQSEKVYKHTRREVDRLHDYIKGLSQAIRDDPGDPKANKSSLICLAVAIENIVSYLKERDDGSDHASIHSET